MAAISNLGVGGLSEVLTLYVMQAFGAPITRELLNSTLFIPATGSNSLIYTRALALLRSDVLLKTRITASERSAAGIKLTTHNPTTGARKLILARKLLITPPPSLNTLAPLSPDAHETRLLSTFTPTWNFIGIAHIPSLPENVSINHFSPEAVPSNHLAVRNWPWTLRLDSTGPVGSGLWRVLFATDFAISHQQAKATVASSVANLFQEGGIYAGQADGEAEFRAFADHNSVLWRQEAGLLRQGLVGEIYALQGRRSTWFTGNLWSGDYTGNVWAFTEDLLPRLVESLGE